MERLRIVKLPVRVRETSLAACKRFRPCKLLEGHAFQTEGERGVLFTTYLTVLGRAV